MVLGLLLALARQGSAIELSLEENRAQRGNIGFVDMRKVYRLFPETLRAKEHFEEVIRQAEEQVGLRKAEILKLKNEIARLRAEQDALKKLAPPPPPPAPAPAPAPAEPPPPAAPIGAASKETLSAAAALLAQEGLTVSTKGGSDQAALDALLSTRAAVAALPGLTAPASSGVVITTEIQTSTPPPAAAPAPPPAPPAPHAGALAELEEKITVKSRELETRERDFKEHQGAAEKNLMDLESRRTEILLGKIHKAVQETARREGISVVVDKGAILFGHEAVDLTEKVLKSLKGS